MAKHRMPPMGMGGGMGMSNMNNMLKQAQKMQQDMLKMQEELEVATFEGTSGGGAITVTASGKKEITAIKISPEVVDADDVEMLEDLILVAVNEAMKKVDSANSEKLGKLTGGMNIPGLF